jgi:microcystin-dependent protein
MTKNILFLSLLLVFGSNAQVKIGDNHTTVNANSLLELESTNKGLLLPRIALVSTTNPSPLSAHIAGMIVFNTNIINDVSAGLYINNGTSWVALAVAINPIGSVITMTENTIPTGYLYCNGQAVSRTTYAGLFALIGTKYGTGDGSTTFNVPDFRGYFLRGQNDGSGNDPNASTRTNSGNGTTGDAVGTKQDDATAINGLKVKSFLWDNGLWHNDNTTVAMGANVNYNGGSNTTNSAALISQDTETRPININVRYYIKF